MTRKRNRKPKVPDPVMYWLNVIDWHSSYSATRDGPELPDFFREEDGAPWEHLAVDLDVELREPVKGVTKGKVSVVGSRSYDLGAYLYYNDDHELGGLVTVTREAFQALLTLLVAGKGVVLDFHGPPFRYRKTYARNAGWATVGHQTLIDEEV